MRKLLPLAVLLLACAPLTLAAQTVRGTLVESGGDGVSGARVVLLDTEGRTVAAATTGAGGAFSLTAREAGLYRLRAERIGFAATFSTPFSLSAGETRAERLVAGAQRVQLQGISVQAAARCEVRPREGAQSAVVWEEARKALELANAAAASEAYRFDATSFERSLDPYTRAVTREETRTLTGFRGVPYAAASPDRLARQGWVSRGRDQMVFYAPDAAVLLSDVFLDGHCFRVVAHPDPASGLVGLGFEPVRERREPDVEGVVWVDRRTAELRSLDYRYTGLELREEARDAGGRVEFRRLPSGAWIVSRWAIRMPVVESGFNAPGWRTTSEARRLATVGFREEGGVVTAVRDASGATVAMEAGATVAGVVTDSTTGLPLAGARVFLANTTYSTTADAQGGFVLMGLPDGRYEVTFASPRLDSLRYLPTPVPVELASGHTTRRDLAVPPLARMLTEPCDSAAADAGRLAGFVRADSTGAPVAGVRVVLAWTDAGGARREQEARTDYRGVYRFCAAPRDVPLALAVHAPGGATGTAGGVRLAGAAPLQQDLTLPREAAAAALLTTAVEGQTHVQIRVVEAETGRPLSGALVKLGESSGRRTDREGELVLSNVSLGTYTVSVSHPAHGERTVQAAVNDLGGVQLELRVPRRREAVALAPVVATSRPMPRELARALEEKNRSGARRYVITPDMMRRITTGSPHVEPILRAYVPGIRVREVMYPRTTFLWYISITYRGTPVTVYVDGRLASGEEVARLRPSMVQWIEFLPTSLANSRGYLTRGGEAVLVLHTLTGPPGSD